MNEHRQEGIYLGAGQWAESENQALVAAGFTLTYEEADLWSKDGVLFGRKAALASLGQTLHPNTARAAEEVTWREPTVTRRSPVQRKALSNKEIATIKHLRSVGMSQARIGIIVGVSTTTVWRALKSP